MRIIGPSDFASLIYKSLHKQHSKKDLWSKECSKSKKRHNSLAWATNSLSASGNLPVSFRYLPVNLVVFSVAAKAST